MNWSKNIHQKFVGPGPRGPSSGYATASWYVVVPLQNHKRNIENKRILGGYILIYGQGSQKLYNWQNIVSPPHYRNDVHHPHDIICLYCRGLQDESEYIYFYIVYVSHLSSIDEYCRTFGSNTVILACLQTNIAHSNLLHKKSINCNQTI